MNNKYTYIQHEIQQLQEILESIGKDAVIERMGYEHRLAELQKKLASIIPSAAPKTFSLTFKGAPVDGSKAIAASFASKATDSFSDAYDMVVAALSGNLGDATSGPVVNKNQYELFIKNIAIGSFGFEFQLPTEAPGLLDDMTVAEMAVQKIENIFRMASQENDEEIADAIDEIPPRAIKKIYSFLEQLEKSKAWCGLSFGRYKFQFENLEQLSQAALQLKEDNIAEEEQSFNGVLLGVLPDSKMFEFKISDRSQIIKGKISPDLKETDSLAAEWSSKKSTINCKLVTVGKGKPRYTLTNIKASQKN